MSLRLRLRIRSSGSEEEVRGENKLNQRNSSKTSFISPLSRSLYITGFSRVSFKFEICCVSPISSDVSTMQTVS